MNFFQNIHFVNWWVLGFLLLLPLIYWWYYRSLSRNKVTLRMPNIGSFQQTGSWRSALRKLLPLLRILALGSLIFALARPQKTLKEEDIKAEGIDIFLVMDLSSSMLSRDFDPDRLEVSKQVAANFVDKRPHDRIGLTVFSGEAFTQCPLTTDHRIVKEFLSTLQCGFLADGTAIGMGLSSAVNRIKDSKSESKVVILLTDGVNNSGYIQPMTAAEIAKEFAVKVYTIGVGSTGMARSPVRKRRDGTFEFDFTRVEIDEALLRQIAEQTGGNYFRATNETELGRIYDYIDKLEKTEIDVTIIKRHSEMFHPFALIALILILLEILLRHTVLRSLP